MLRELLTLCARFTDCFLLKATSSLNASASFEGDETSFCCRSGISSRAAVRTRVLGRAATSTKPAGYALLLVKPRGVESIEGVIVKICREDCDAEASCSIFCRNAIAAESLSPAASQFKGCRSSTPLGVTRYKFYLGWFPQFDQVAMLSHGCTYPAIGQTLPESVFP